VRAGGWTLRKTMLVTIACGIGHVASSVLLGLAGLALGTAVARLVDIEDFRGGTAGWLLFGIGLAYMMWGCVAPGSTDRTHICTRTPTAACTFTSTGTTPNTPTCTVHKANLPPPVCGLRRRRGSCS